jgi:hypothetical protein
MMALSKTSSTDPAWIDTTLQVRLRCTKLGSVEAGSVMLALPEQWPADTVKWTHGAAATAARGGALFSWPKESVSDCALIVCATRLLSGEADTQQKLLDCQRTAGNGVAAAANSSLLSLLR